MIIRTRNRVIYSGQDAVNAVKRYREQRQRQQIKEWVKTKEG